MPKETKNTVSTVWRLDTQGNFHEEATYTIPPKATLVAFIMQEFKHNGNTWDYPDEVEGMMVLPKSKRWAWIAPNDDVYYVIAV